MGKLLTNEVGLQMLAEMKRQTAISEAAARDQIAALASQMSSIAKIVRDGYGSVLMDIGDQLNIDWTDGSKSYNVPHDIVHFADVDLKNGDKVPGMYIQWHFCSPFGVQFDAAEAFYYAETELAAGTYNIIVGDNWGDNCKKNEQYQFTLSKPVPAGGQIAGFYSMPDKKAAEWTVQTFTDAKSTTPIETVKPTAGSNGTNLGTLSFAGDGKLNSLQRVAYGYNRWSQSAIRQYLNSAKAAGQWWEPQHKWDRPPAELASKPGFLSGYSDDFLNAIKPVRVRTALKNCGFALPPKHITINFTPANIRKSGSGFDLPVAVAVLTAFGYIRQEMVRATRRRKWDEMISFQKESEALLNATLEMDTDAVAAGIEKIHMDYASTIQYHDENSLSSVLTIAYLSSMKYYFKPIRELPTGRGFADFVYLPKPEYREDYPALVVEMKWNQKAVTAIEQIKEKRYPESLKQYTGDLLLAGISYNKKTKEYQCKIESNHD